MIRSCQLAAALLAVCCVGAAGAKPPADDIEQLTTTLPSLNPGQTAWVSTLWRGASDDATSFRMEADGPSGITISYPENTPGYSSLYKDSTLLAQDTDYASLKVHEWIHDPGIPSNAPAVKSERFERVNRQIAAFRAGARASQLDTRGWTTLEWQRFLDNLPSPLSAALSGSESRR